MITIISGTNRPDSSTLKVARQVEGIYRKLQVEVQLLDLQELPKEIFESLTSWFCNPHTQT